MMWKKEDTDYTLYVVTDRNLMSSSSIEESVELSILGGATLIQLREKKISSKDFLSLAWRVKKITDAYDVPLIINDRVDIALAVGAAGIHIGQSDFPADIVRNMIGKETLLGVSATTLKEAITAEKDGADYIGVGAMYVTSTKTDAKPVSMHTLQEICNAVSIPIVVIGGICEENITDFADTDIDGIAVVSAVISKDNVTEAAAKIKTAFIDIVQNGQDNV